MTHEGVVVTHGWSPETVVLVSVPLKLTAKKLIKPWTQNSMSQYQIIHILNSIKCIKYMAGFFFFFPFEMFIKSTPSRPVLVPLPSANIYHCLKVHLLIHQSFGDLCCLLEMDIVYRKKKCVRYVTEHQSSSFHQGKQNQFVQSFTGLPGSLSATTCLKTENYPDEVTERTVCCAVDQKIADCFEVLRSGHHWGILFNRR